MRRCLCLSLSISIFWPDFHLLFWLRNFFDILNQRMITSMCFHCVIKTHTYTSIAMRSTKTVRFLLLFYHFGGWLSPLSAHFFQIFYGNFPNGRNIVRRIVRKSDRNSLKNPIENKWLPFENQSN